jgi:hypothetical protein
VCVTATRPMRGGLVEGGLAFDSRRAPSVDVYDCMN